MSRDDIIRMAREAGFVDASFCRWSAYTDDLERFAALVAALSARRGEPVAEPSYFGLTKDHTWLSVSKEQYDKLKPQGRMACIFRSER